ncbi:hypothetical protein Hanom_Chr10g00940061 [Helianthus anomalus]
MHMMKIIIKYLQIKIQEINYPLYTSPKDPLPMSSKSLNRDPAASMIAAASAIFTNH